MGNYRSTKLKISFITNEEINQGIRELIYKRIARVIYESPEFQKVLNESYESPELNETLNEDKDAS